MPQSSECLQEVDALEHPINKKDTCIIKQEIVEYTVVIGLNSKWCSYKRDYHNHALWNYSQAQNIGRIFAEPCNEQEQ